MSAAGELSHGREGRPFPTQNMWERNEGERKLSL